MMMLLVMSLSPYYISGLNPASAQVNSPLCKELTIIKVAANGERGAGSAGLAVDKDIKTRWANDGKGSFIQLDLGESEAICNIDVDENIDNGGWGSEGSECGGKPDQILTWGGPVATFRWDGATDVDIRNFSVREIRPPQ
jgi:hypothetical protein